jgi:glycine oxidase
MNVHVIGAGVIGAACAEELAAAGHEVHVLDMRGPGRGASQASAGVLAPFIEGHHGDPLLELCTQSLELYDAFIARVRETSGRAVEFARTGTLEVAMSDSDADRLRRLHATLVRNGIDTEWLEGGEARAFDPAVASTCAGALRPRARRRAAARGRQAHSRTTPAPRMAG